MWQTKASAAKLICSKLATYGPLVLKLVRIKFDKINFEPLNVTEICMKLTSMINFISKCVVCRTVEGIDSTILPNKHYIFHIKIYTVPETKTWAKWCRQVEHRLQRIRIHNQDAELTKQKGDENRTSILMYRNERN